MKLLIIIGNAAVGKTTVGNELIQITDLKLFHGHMILEPIYKIYGKRNIDVEKKIRDIIFDDFAKSNNHGLIFTYMMNFDSKSDWDYIEHISSFFKKENADIYFVELVASQDVRLKRNLTESRLFSKPSKKERSNDVILETDKSIRCVSNENEIPFENYIKIDNSNLLPDIAAKMIKEKFSL